LIDDTIARCRSNVVWDKEKNIPLCRLEGDAEKCQLGGDGRCQKFSVERPVPTPEEIERNGGDWRSMIGRARGPRGQECSTSESTGRG
jgi:hypothetical protein